MKFARHQRVAKSALKTIPEEQSEHFLSSKTINCSNDDDHHLVNVARSSHGLAPVERAVHLDELAQAHANSMAQKQSVFHSVNSVNALRNKLCSIHVGENILRGQSIVQMHNETMSQPTSFLRNNILCHTFDQFGMGTALGKDGLVYLVQVFRSTKE